MKHKHDRLKQAKKTTALVKACSLPIEQAVAVALTSIGGTVFDAKLKEKNDQVVWRIKLLTAGGERVKLYIDGRSGSVIEAMREEPRIVSETIRAPEAVEAALS